jgi:exoribonuclease II
VEATVWRENLVRLTGMPYMTKVHALPVLKPGSKVQLVVQKIDTLLMELECRFVRVVEETVVEETAADETATDSETPETGDTAADVVENA